MHAMWVAHGCIHAMWRCIAYKKGIGEGKEREKGKKGREKEGDEGR